MNHQQINPPSYMWGRIEKELDRQDEIELAGRQKPYGSFSINCNLIKKSVIFKACVILIVCLIAIIK